jgi:3-hydroxymyristoyl/3-hydroxydecanoyl-(acyl carrier protein) dehydratase
MNDTFTTEFFVPADHPALAGHFPGQPVVPGVVLLDAVLAAVRTRNSFVLEAIPGAKFLGPVLPDERIELRIHLTTVEGAKVRVAFRGLRATSTVFEGSFTGNPDSTP